MLSISLPFFRCHSDLRSVQEFAARWGWWSFGQRSAEPLQKQCLGHHLGDLHGGTMTREDLRGSKKRSKIMKIWGNHEKILKHTVDYSRLQITGGFFDIGEFNHCCNTYGESPTWAMLQSPVWFLACHRMFRCFVSTEVLGRPHSMRCRHSAWGPSDIHMALF
jgi:hypothetical protein